MELPTQSELQEYFFSGLLRNVNAILAGVYGTGLNIPPSNRLRGERSDDVLALLMREEDLLGVIRRVLSPECRTIRQGRASLHDLALGHALLCAAQKIKDGKTVRASSTIGSSMLLGSVMPALRMCYLRFEQAFPEKLVGELEPEDIQASIRTEWSRYLADLDTATEREQRAKYLKELLPRLKDVRFVLGLFSWIVHCRLDDRSIDDFLAALPGDGTKGNGIRK